MYHRLNFRFIFFCLISFSVAGCNSLGFNNSSLASRSTKLSNGIQSTFQVSKTTANQLSPIIIVSAEQYAVDPILLSALIYQESSYRSQARSPTGAVGLTQVIPSYWAKYCPGDLYNATVNIQCGSYILSSYYRQAGSWKKALAYYNVGPTGYNSSFKTRHKAKKYANSVLKHKKRLKHNL